MLRKRIIGVVTVKDGWAVQSFGYKRYLPLGRPETLVENLDRWGADEILVKCIDRSGGGRGPDFGLLERLGQIGLATPLIYGGGIRSLSDAIASIHFGADRVCVDAVLHDAPDEIRIMSAHLGAQALIAALPLSAFEGEVFWYDYRTRGLSAISSPVLEMLASGAVSEALLIDWKNDGGDGLFNMELVNRFPIRDVPLIAFGGLRAENEMRELLRSSTISAIAIGNALNYGEHAIHKFKHRLADLPLRHSFFSAISQEKRN